MDQAKEVIKKDKVGEIDEAINHLSNAISGLSQLGEIIDTGEIQPPADKQIDPPRRSLLNLMNNLPEQLHNMANNISNNTENIRKMIL